MRIGAGVGRGSLELLLLLIYLLLILSAFLVQGEDNNRRCSICLLFDEIVNVCSLRCFMRFVCQSY